MFILHSKVAIYASPAYVPLTEHIILVRERILHPGEVIRAKGSVSTDVEDKYRMDADVRIMVLDEKRLQITWSQGWGSKLMARIDKRIFKEFAPDREGFFGKEIVEGESGESFLSIPYRSVRKSTLPEAFTWFDNLCLPRLIDAKMKKLEGIKSPQRETTLLYEPGLPAQARK